MTLIGELHHFLVAFFLEMCEQCYVNCMLADAEKILWAARVLRKAQEPECERSHIWYLQGQARAEAHGQGDQGAIAAAAVTAPAEGHAKPDQRDADAEEELTSAARSDPFAAYDVEVTLEGEAIREYMALLAEDAS